jgi:hypothetical protein
MLKTSGDEAFFRPFSVGNYSTNVCLDFTVGFIPAKFNKQN